AEAIVDLLVSLEAPEPDTAAGAAGKEARRRWAQRMRRRKQRGGEVVRVRMLVATYWQKQRLKPGQEIDLPRHVAERWCCGRRPLAVMVEGAPAAPAPEAPTVAAPAPETVTVDVTTFGDAERQTIEVPVEPPEAPDPPALPPTTADLTAKTVPELRELAE